MYRLLEVTYTNGKESPALYPTDEQAPFASETELMAEYETKLGAAMKADAYKVEYLLAFDHTGKIYGQEYHTKDDTIALNPRLIKVTATKTGETAEQNKKDNLTILEGDYHSSKGSAMKNSSVLAILNMGFNGKDISINDYWGRPVEVPVPQAE